MFLCLKILELVHIEILNQFSLSSFEIREFSLFNQILLSLFDVSKITYETSNKHNKI